MTELSPDQVAEIRERWCPLDLATNDEILALCDTADALRTERDAAVETRDEANIKLGTLEGETVLERLGLVETTARMHAELDTLRGIVARVSDNWGFPLPGQQLNRSRRRWFRLQDGDLNWVGIEEEPMSEAEIAAIYGTGKETER